jgi:hypothetical protein
MFTDANYRQVLCSQGQHNHLFCYKQSTAPHLHLHLLQENFCLAATSSVEMCPYRMFPSSMTLRPLLQAPASLLPSQAFEANILVNHSCLMKLFTLESQIIIV